MTMTRINKPWGHEDLVHVGDTYVVKRLFMTAGNSCSLQYHELKHETIIVFAGELLFKVGISEDDLREVKLGAGDTWVIPPGVIHQMEAITDCTYIEASTPQLDDVVRLQDKYGRA